VESLQTVGDETFDMKEGDTINIPAGLLHRAKTLELPAPFLALAFLRPTGSRLAKPHSDFNSRSCGYRIHKGWRFNLSGDRIKIVTEFREEIVGHAPIQRLPTETAITDQVREFSKLTLHR
jgi:hypothetical protein